VREYALLASRTLAIERRISIDIAGASAGVILISELLLGTLMSDAKYFSPMVARAIRLITEGGFDLSESMIIIRLFRVY